MGNLTKTTYASIIIAVTLVILWIRPWFHGLVMGLYTNPMLILFAICAITCSIYAKKQVMKKTIIYGILALVFFLLMIFGSTFIQIHTVYDTQYTVIDTMYESTQARTVPLAVASRFGSDSLQKSKEKLGDFDPILVNDSQYWIAPRVPNGGFLYLIQKVQGVLLVDAQSTDRKTELVDQEFKFGEQTGLFDNIYWKLYKEKYFATIDEIYYLHHDSEFKLVAPYITYKFSFPVMRPVFGGVFVVDANGKINQYPVNEIPEWLKSERVYPESLARLEVESYKYKNGLWNALFIHNDQIEVTDLPGQGNQQPFLLDTVDGAKWVIAVEPYGESFGVFKIFFVDAVTGQVDIYELDDTQSLTGPIRVVSFARSQFPTIDWSTSLIIEPRPYIKNNQLYWMLSIVPKDYAGISKTVFVNAATNKVTENSISGSIETTSSNSSIDKATIEQRIAEVEAALDALKKALEESN